MIWLNFENLFRYLTEIENTLKAIDGTNEDSLTIKKMTKELTKLKNELEYFIDQSSTLQSKFFIFKISLVSIILF